MKILWQHFQIVISYSLYYFSFLSFILFLLLFSLVFSPPHMYTHRIPYSPFFFIYFPLDSRTSLSLSFSSSLFLSSLFLYFFFFFFYLIPEHSQALSMIRNEERGKERKNGWVRWLRSAAPSALLSVPCLLLHGRRLSSSPMQPRWVRWLVSFFFFPFFAFIVMI